MVDSQGFIWGGNALIVGNNLEMWEGLAVLKVDDRYRVLLDKEVRELLEVKPGDEVLAIPYSQGVIISPLKGKKFRTSLPGFRYKEGAHEASRYLFRKK